MSTPAIPTKTALGHEELRHRVHRLSQRHRTVLLLVDGVRPLAEVLGMAQKAGASTQHFEELLRLGLVELPVPPAPPPAVQEPAGVLRSVSVPALAPAPQAAPAAEAATPQPQGPLARALAEAAQPAPEAHPAQPPSAAKAPAPARRRTPAPAARPSRRGAAPPPPPLTLDVPLELPVLTVIEEAPGGGPTPSETAVHEQVLALLRTVVHREPPPFTSRVPARLARCESLRELGDLVLEIERYLVHSRRERNLHEVMPLLREARELLGLGNTRVVGPGGEELG
ncbi:hypothetical protein [Caldimonas sp.]|uniref:hypothetical protein n=1 Tax=Caldimonas sp. TaxID=2838790 RepID=UPI00391BD2B0